MATLRQQYIRQRARLRGLETRILSEGGAFVKNLIPPEPKKITAASVRRLKNITIDKAYAKAEFFEYDEHEPDTLKTISGKEYREEQKRQQRKRRSQQAKKRRQEKKKEKGLNPKFEENAIPMEEVYHTMIQNLSYEMSYFPDQVSMYFHNWLNDVVSKYGEEPLAKALDNLGATFTDYVMRYRHDYFRGFKEFETDVMPLVKYYMPIPEAEDLSEFFDNLEE